MIASAYPERHAPEARPQTPWWWVAAAFIAAVLIAAVETRLREMQSALLIYFLASFWLAFPRRAPAVALYAALAVAPFIVHLVTGTPDNWSATATLVALILGTTAGAAGGRAFAELETTRGADDGEPPRSSGARSGVGPRALLSLALTAFAALGVSPVWASLRWGGLALGLLHIPPIAASLVAVRWAQALTLVAWVLLTPALLRVRRRLRLRAGHDEASWLTAREITGHVAVVASLIAVHAAVLTALGEVIGARVSIFIGAPPPVTNVWLACVASYALFDLLTYIAILALAFVTDRARQTEEARRRAAALEATALTARLAALKARLDPHFLYNALNAAVTLARRGQGDDTSRVLEELTALLRYVLDESRSSVPLSEELAFVRRYLDIMQLRFGARLTYSIRVDAAVTDAPVPPLILQPLVENAVEHGVANATDPVAVRVSARLAPRGLVVVVEDDGPGPNAVPTSGSGIGLGATRERLAMLFGEAAALTLEPRAPRGAVTELTLPMPVGVPA